MHSEDSSLTLITQEIMSLGSSVPGIKERDQIIYILYILISLSAKCSLFLACCLGQIV